MAIVSFDAAMAGGAAIVAVNKMAQSAADRRKDSLIGKKEVYHTRRFHQQAQDDETRWAFYKVRQQTNVNIQIWQKLPLPLIRN
jgi:hypothetical protein